MSAKRRLVVVGNGMAGARLVEEVLARGGGHRYDVVVFGEEPVGNYNRILLSGVLAGTHDPKDIFLNPLSWYASNGVTLHAGVRVKGIDTAHKEVTGADGTVERYDSLVIATGSRPLIPPIDGVSHRSANGRSRKGHTTFKRGVFVFRTLADCDRMLAFVSGVRRAAVIGGGLLGLEAARGLLNAGLDVHVVHLMSHLMEMQLDAKGGRVLQRQLEQMGLHVHLQKATTAVLGDAEVTGLAFEDGSTLECQMLVIAAGIRANVDLAVKAGLTVKRGIIVGDDLACEGAPDIYAIGECAEHRGRVYGLVAPLWEQAHVLADRLSGKNPHALYAGSKIATKLKVAGVDVASMGEKDPAEEDDEVVSYADPARGIYKKLVVRHNRLVGAIVIGDGATVPSLQRLFSESTLLPDDRAELLFRALAVAPAQPQALPDTAQICDCNGVTKAQIIEAVLRGAHSVRAVCDATRAGTGCGSCHPEVQAIVELACEGLVAPEVLAEVADQPARVRAPAPANAVVTHSKMERYTRKNADAVLTDANREKLVVVGNGMAGARVVEEILKRAPNRFDIVMFGAEPYGNYNRILLSNVLNGTQSAPDIFMNPLSWYRDNGITLHAGVKATHIDRARRMVVGTPLKKTALAYAADAAGDDEAAIVEAPYDHVVIATGSRPFVPPMEGFGGPGTFLFRTIDDCDRIADYAKASRRAAVIGGGLLGLEAARGLLTHEVEVTVLEAAPQLMMAQLDQESGDMLRATIEGMGIKVLSNAITTRIVRADGRITHLEFKDGSRLETDMVVVSAGIRPITEIATASGLTVNKAIVCDDQMRTSDPAIFALGECVEHCGKIYGLVDPIWDMAQVLADVITGTNPDAAYLGSKLGTKLKVMGVELASMGETRAASPADEVVVYREPAHGIYKKLIVRDGQIAGAILLGEIEDAGVLMQMFMAGSKVPARRAELLFGSPTGVSLLNASDLPDNAQICNCNGVSKRQIVEAIQTQGCQSVSRVGACTKAGLGCGSCKGLVAQLLEGYLGEVGYDPTEHYYVPGVALEKSQLVTEIKSRGLKSVSAVFQELAAGQEDPASKVGLASLLKTLWPDEYDDERDARFINDRVHANIQKDGTFSVVPRIYAGVTTAAELMRIAEVAVKYHVPTVKITGGQRIDLLGIKKDDLPGVWKDLGMPSGHAYTKAFRTCKSCVGTDFCRYGVGDSIALAQKIERRFQGVESPHKMKLATAGCPRNCSEAYVKDIGAVAIDGGQWEIYLGGAAGGSVRKGDLLCTVTTHDEVLTYMGRFIQYYREHGRYLERTYRFLERIGIDTLRKILVEDSLGICARLDADIQKAVDAYVDPWQEAERPAYHAQFREAELTYALEVAENNG